LVHPEDRSALLQRREDRLAGRPAESRYTLRVVDRAGSVHWAENQVIVLPWEGHPATLNFLQDVTERNRAEEELQVRAQLLDKANDSIFLLDQDGRIVYANETACKVRGYDREKMLLMNIRDLVPAEYAERVGPRISDIFAKGEAVFESAHMKQDGTIFPVEISVRAMEIGIKKFIIALSATSRTKRAEEELRRASAVHGLIEKGAGRHRYRSRWKTSVNELSNLYGFRSVDELIGQPSLTSSRESREMVRSVAEAFARKTVPSNKKDRTTQMDRDFPPTLS
jgi:PAS domain S-box-containing protein